jgi:hypothetical protein
MLLRVVLGFTALVAFVALGAWINRLRQSGTVTVRAVAGKVHWGVGVVAIAVLALLLVTAIGVLVD